MSIAQTTIRRRIHATFGHLVAAEQIASPLRFGLTDEQIVSGLIAGGGPHLCEDPVPRERSVGGVPFADGAIGADARPSDQAIRIRIGHGMAGFHCTDSTVAWAGSNAQKWRRRFSLGAAS
ncbi:MAG: hypothetical protein ABSB33_04190 [Tepidisphaeraceae bacterium]